MRTFALAIGALLIAVASPGAAQAAVYACNVADAWRLGPDGEQIRDERTQIRRRLHGRFTFNDRTGRVAGLREEWVLSVLQKPIGPNTLLAVSIHKGPGNTALQILKINTFEKERMPFLWVSDDEISSGVCTTGGE